MRQGANNADRRQTAEGERSAKAPISLRGTGVCDGPIIPFTECEVTETTVHKVNGTTYRA